MRPYFWCMLLIQVQCWKNKRQSSVCKLWICCSESSVCAFHFGTTIAAIESLNQSQSVWDARRRRRVKYAALTPVVRRANVLIAVRRRLPFNPMNVSSELDVFHPMKLHPVRVWLSARNVALFRECMSTVKPRITGNRQLFFIVCFSATASSEFRCLDGRLS